MVVRRILNDELYHHGVQGQKWGKRNGPPYPLGSNISTGKALKTGVRRIKSETKKAVNKVEKVDQKYQISDRTKKVIKAALITAGALTVAGAIAYGYNVNKKMNLDTVLNNTKFRRYQGSADFDNKGSAYVSTGLLDKIQYKKYAADVGSNYKLDLIGDNIKIPSIKNSRNIFIKQMADKNIKNGLNEQFTKNLEYYKNQDMTPPNIRRIKLFKEALRRINNDNYSKSDIKVLYDAWNTSITNNKQMGGWDTTNKIFDAFKQNGYNTIWDTHDLYISGYHSKNPMIVFDKNNLTLKSAKRISDAELKVGQMAGNGMTIGKNYMSMVNNSSYRPIKILKNLNKEYIKPVR